MSLAFEDVTGMGVKSLGGWRECRPLQTAAGWRSGPNVSLWEASAVSGSKAQLALARNAEISRLFRGDSSLGELAARFGLTSQRIGQIVRDPRVIGRGGRRARPDAGRAYPCSGCGAELLVPAAGPVARRCRQCRTGVQKHSCRNCSKPLSGHLWYCGPDCAAQRRRARWHAVNPLQPLRQFTCDECGKTAETRTRGKSAARFCSALCHRRAAVRARWQANSRRHFPRVQGKQRRLIFERDGWRCGICPAVIDQRLKWPHPGSASIDHVDPLGAHEPANWQASHLACNVQAGAKGRKAAA